MTRAGASVETIALRAARFPQFPNASGVTSAQACPATSVAMEAAATRTARHLLTHIAGQCTAARKAVTRMEDGGAAGCI